MKTGVCRVAVVVATASALLLTGIAAGATSSVTITSPRAGQSVSLKKNPYLAVAGGVSFAATAPGTTTFYLRRDGCGTSNDNPHLSTTSGTDTTSSSSVKGLPAATCHSRATTARSP